MGLSIDLAHVHHEYPAEDTTGVCALEDVNLSLEAGSFSVLMGPSGSGKSTLLNLIGAVDRATRGSILIGDLDLTKLNERSLTRYRRTSVGFVFQFFNLIPTLTVEENVSFPLALGGAKPQTIRERARETLARVGLEHRSTHFPNQLSGGEMQRVAIGRAVIHRPPILLADEPTGNLDTKTGEAILELISDLHREFKPTIVMATHSQKAASYGGRLFQVVDGSVSEGVA